MKTMARYFLTVLIVLSFVSCSGGSKVKKEDKGLNIEEHFQLAYRAAERGNMEEAVNEYQKVLKLDPKHLKAHLNLGIVYGKQGKLKEEVSEYKRAISIDPKFAEAYFNLGVAYNGRGDLNEAITQYQKALQINPSYVEAHNNLGNIYFRRGKMDEALSEYRQTVEINPVMQRDIIISEMSIDSRESLKRQSNRFRRPLRSIRDTVSLITFWLSSILRKRNIHKPSSTANRP